MKYLETKERSAELLRRVVVQMAKHDAAYHPISYALWYECIAGINPPLKETVDRLVESALRLKDEQVWDLYNRHISERDQELAQQLNIDLQRVLDEVTRSAAEAGEEAGRYGNSLQRHSDHIRQTPDATTVQSVVTGLLRDTTRMRQSVTTLQSQLTESSREAENLRTALQRAEGEAITDPLTGLRNRRGFDKVLRQALADSSTEADTCLLMVDIDHFKKVNDSYGHLLGDKVLRVVAQALKSNVKGQDTVARFGGEEFAILLPNTPLPGAQALAENIRAMVQNGRIRRTDNNELIDSITVSIGATRYRHGETTDDFIHRADLALYASKQNGRNRVTVSDLEATAATRLAISSPIAVRQTSS